MKVFVPQGVGIKLAGTGAYLPERVVTNAEVVALGAGLSEDEIVRLSGIARRHWAAPGEATSDLAVHAARAALAQAGQPASAVDRLIVATVSPDHLSPSTACFVQQQLGLSPIPAFDVAASCSGFLFALELGARAIATGDRCVLAVAADVRSRWLDPTDRATAALFGDGAGAAVLTSGPSGEGLLGIGLLVDGSGARSVYVPGGGSRDKGGSAFIAMAEGPQVYLAAVEGMVATAEQLLSALGQTFDDVDLVVPHQPNKRILDRLARVARLPPQKLFINVDRIGNVSGATCAIALDEAIRTGAARPGMRVLLVTAGAGYTAGAALLQL
ncbi:MAG: beta-ketoacyl-ACP synthase 3 [Archangiaceae bacterium]|nr:beta-ketoacyl-ACP synthase 3 [Archangiaceae bacterium]